jgi:hypothetical protein
MAPCDPSSSLVPRTLTPRDCHTAGSFAAASAAVLTVASAIVARVHQLTASRNRSTAYGRAARAGPHAAERLVRTRPAFRARAVVFVNERRQLGQPEAPVRSPYVTAVRTIRVAGSGLLPERTDCRMTIRFDDHQGDHLRGTDPDARQERVLAGAVILHRQAEVPRVRCGAGREVVGELAPPGGEADEGAMP